MTLLRLATPEDAAFWLTLDSHINEARFFEKLREKCAYIISDGEKPIGIMRYNLFWDEIPFVNLIYIEESARRKGHGEAALLQWEYEMKAAGYMQLLISTQADERAQHLYRRLCYKDAGCLILDTQAAEIFMIKSLKA